MPGFLCAPKPQSTFAGKKPKAGLPKWSTSTDPLS